MFFGQIMKNQRFRSVLLYVISLAIVAAFIYYLYINSDKFLGILHISPLFVAVILILSLANPVLNGAINTYMFQGLGADLSHRDGFLLAAVSTLANQLPVPGGLVSKGIYLKRKYNLTYTKYLSATLALFFCFIAVNGFIGVVILLYWILYKGIAVPIILLGGFSLMTVCLSIFWLPLGRIKIPKMIHGRIHQAEEGWMLISGNPVLLLKLIGIQSSLMLILALRYWLAFHMLSQSITIGQAILFSSASVLTQLVSIAPGGLGVREAIVGGVASALGFDIGVSIVAVGLDRLIVTISIVILGGISTIIMGKEISEPSMEDGKQDK
jgi:uncharacterized membrane protein YbhN (UPF0104 family)